MEGVGGWGGEVIIIEQVNFLKEAESWFGCDLLVIVLVENITKRKKN